MKEKFDFVNDIVLYSPILSTIERTAINELGCTVLHDKGAVRDEEHSGSVECS